jgi:hypothetical protein
MEEVPVILLRHLSPARRRALVIADNQLAIAGAGWDEERLRIELATVVLANRAARPSVVTFTVFGHYGSGQFGSGGSTAGRSRAVLQARR